MPSFTYLFPSDSSVDSYTLTMLTVLIYVLTSTNTSRASLPSRSSVRQVIRYLVDIVPVSNTVFFFLVRLSSESRHFLIAI